MEKCKRCGVDVFLSGNTHCPRCYAVEDGRCPECDGCGSLVALGGGVTPLGSLIGWVPDASEPWQCPACKGMGVPDGKKFRVVRQATPVPRTLHGEDSRGTIWQGSDPSQYRAGIGCFDEGETIINRWMEEYSAASGWQEMPSA
ncbi:MAG: hypothetical protein A3D44_01125 [Candidatus Staskawiczbacteria bacterium RIFCSPHIGHO2_02_FULL_42_22]|uniref:Uncharacterized protein n=1 Tax=Candidatus Staskawiczbacteria bacterium RIFCSPHIGHO2_02_FULL_42_22 TaxID=1802207 RepID=A0A1G2I3E4_9BACT|nr:MAG: hypothetical protein A3D44_01125 [Candidatus Staskawiczbacteria bacterium RIFCSPHIGHO2_02_FULL_42_22]